MKVAFVIFDGMTALDFIGIYDAITRLKKKGYIPNLSWDICAHTSTVHDDNGLGISPTRVSEPLTGYDMVIVPGGTRQLSRILRRLTICPALARMSSTNGSWMKATLSAQAASRHRLTWGCTCAKNLPGARPG